MPNKTALTTLRCSTQYNHHGDGNCCGSLVKKNLKTLKHHQKFAEVKELDCIMTHNSIPEDIINMLGAFSSALGDCAVYVCGSEVAVR